MKTSPAPSKELDLAQGCIDAMNRAATLDDFERQWKLYLHHVERCFSKATAHFQKSPKWGGWHGKYVAIRKEDPLLMYLVQARGADEHTVEDIVEKTFSRMTIDAPPGSKTLHIKRLVIKGGAITELDTPGGSIVKHEPARTRLLPVVNRGRKYEIPTSHLGKKLDPENVPELARIGVEFYRSFLAAAEAFFCVEGK